MPSIQYIDGQPFLVPDEVTELPVGAQPALPTQQNYYPAPPTYHGTEPQAVSLPTQPDMWAQAARAGQRLFGLGGEERYQTWPERTVRSAISLPVEVMKGEVQSGPGLRREDVTDIPGTGQPLDPMMERAQDVAGLAGGTAFSNVAIRGAEKNVLGIVPVAKARELNIKQSVPSEILKSAVENTPGAKIEPDGLVTIKVVRKQSPEQEMSESVRGGVFYLPEGDKNLRHYGTARSYYGGQQKIEGDTAFKNPLVVKGATGGKAPEEAYVQIAGKDSFKQLNQDVMEIVTANNWMRRKDPQAFHNLTSRFFNNYAPELSDLRDYIIDNSNKGNQLRYALQEAAIGSAVRKAGYDGILGYSLKRGADKGKPFISEIFDVRESHYPGSSGEYTIHPELLSETSKVGAPLAALEKAPMFYSNVENAVKASKQNVASKEQWLSYLKNQPGVKPEELEWTVANLPEGKITKQELEQHIAENKVQFNEVWKGGNPEGWHITPPDQTVSGKWMVKSNDYNSKGMHFNTEVEARAALAEKTQYPEHGQSKYQSYQLPGGENYRELLLTLPNRENVIKRARFKEIFEKGEPYGKDKEEYKQLSSDLAKENTGNFKSSHWDEPNVLAHVRMNDRDIPNVGKSLHIEEIQSDWHQAGRKQGYKISKAEKDRMIKELEQIRAERNRLDNDPNQVDKYGSKYDELANKEADLMEKYNKTVHDAVPNAPFKKTWDELALKRTINEAVRNGYDAISWTPGEAQAARYDLSKHISKVEYDPTYKTVNATDLKGNEVIRKQAEPNELPEIIGKEAAEKLLKSETNHWGIHKLEGLDLKVGGEGMKAFYDKMMVDKVNALAKKFGGKVETKEIKGKIRSIEEIQKDINELTNKYKGISYEKIPAEVRRKNAELLNEKNNARVAKDLPDRIHVLKLTPELKKAVSEKGFPLFSETSKVGAPLSALEKLAVKDTSINDAHGGEMFGVKVAKIGDKVIAAADVSILPNEVFVKDIVTREGERRKGYMKKLIDDLFREFPDKRIRISGTTPDGTKFIKKSYNFKKGIITKKNELASSGLQFPKPLEQPTFDERWRERIPEHEFRQPRTKPIPPDYVPPERRFEKRPVRLTKINYTPEF